MTDINPISLVEAPVPAATGWEPIETAPKNGTVIMMWNKRWNMAPAGYWWCDTTKNGDKFGLWVLLEEELELGVSPGTLGWSVDIESGDMPTHWAHLPEEDLP